MTTSRAHPRRVLFIAYFFPPLGGGGVQRAVKFVRYLPDHGWEPIVLTVRESSYWITDRTLADEVADARVVRTFSPDGPWLTSRVRRGADGGGAAVRRGGSTSRLRQLSSFLFLPDAYRPWKPFALRAARRILREEPVDAILTTSSPDTAHLIGRDLALESGVPWIADFRDPWTRRIAFDAPTALHTRWHRAREREVLRDATRVVVTADETRDDFLARDGSLDARKFAVIPNGFDAVDFPDPMPAPSWDRFELVYVGQLTAGRTIAPLLPVLDRLFAVEPDARAATRVRFIGPRESENDVLVRDAGLDDVVRFEPPRPHREAVQILGEAHVVLLLENMGSRAGLIAQGKLYECLFAGRPVLGLVPAGAVSRLVRELGGGETADDRQPERAVDFLARAFRAWRSRELLPGATRPALAPFERGVLTARLADVLGEAARTRPV